MAVAVGDRFALRIALNPAEIAEFARLSGDPNPVHHDDTYARASRFGGIIVSGPQLIARLLGILPSQIPTAEEVLLGLEFTFRFVKAAPANEPLEFAWRVIGKTAKERLEGEILELAGTVQNDSGTEYLAASGKALVLRQA